MTTKTAKVQSTPVRNPYLFQKWTQPQSSKVYNYGQTTMLDSILDRAVYKVVSGSVSNRKMTSESVQILDESIPVNRPDVGEFYWSYSNNEALTTGVANSMLQFDKYRQRFNEESLQECRTLILEVIAKYGEPAILTDCWRIAGQYANNPDADLKSVQKGYYSIEAILVKWFAFKVARKLMRSLIKNGESINRMLSLQSESTTDVEQVQNWISSHSEKNIMTVGETLVLDLPYILSKREREAIELLIVGLKQEQIVKVAGIHFQTIANAKKKIREYMQG